MSAAPNIPSEALPGFSKERISSAARNNEAMLDAAIDFFVSALAALLEEEPE